MNIEGRCDGQPALRERAARHAALGDPTRLRIVELLAQADRSPKWLRERLGISATLLTHHLALLESAGLLTRRRSEGDGRRHYLQLRRHALPALCLPPFTGVRSVLFVCTGNTARSPVAAGLWRALSPVPADSAGTFPAGEVPAAAIDAADTIGVDLSEHRPKRLTSNLDFRTPDPRTLVITVCDRAYERLVLDGAERGHIVHWSIPDPRRTGTAAAYHQAFAAIRERVCASLPGAAGPASRQGAAS